MAVAGHKGVFPVLRERLGAASIGIFGQTAGESSRLRITALCRSFRVGELDRPAHVAIYTLSATTPQCKNTDPVGSFTIHRLQAEYRF
ncbi:hypothetical protein ABH15_09595 [Methanoculleus taiwanensis]|uniref:Uncharacterized protein n=1 Tax=Methanoculleus taiwanensis TaxID=1550565 RepID=A0A498H2M5_9EURY|nr:hypothetical protein [Methanoculleus taiwanensis]RXE56350.1 hypothetical protein ABH15_09595 [Methanoculleus taiwanensis]